MLKPRCRKVGMFLSLWVLLRIPGNGVLLYAQQNQVEQNDYEEMEKFLPSDNDADDDAKVLLMIQCTACHSARATKDRIAQRTGGDLTFWTTLARRMNTTWNAKIPDEDLDAIVAYLAKHFGPSAVAAPRTGNAQQATSVEQSPQAATGKGDAAKGKAIFQTYCIGCHDPDSETAKVGPGLKGLFRKSVQRKVGEIRQVIETGSNVMPPMKGRLSEQEFANLLAYLQSL